jgi:tubulin beta
MSEVITLQVGQCGNQIGAKFWELISNEHGIDLQGKFVGTTSLQSDGLSVYYNESSSGNYCPRAIAIDFDSNSLNQFKNCSVG